MALIGMLWRHSLIYTVDCRNLQKMHFLLEKYRQRKFDPEKKKKQKKLKSHNCYSSYLFSPGFILSGVVKKPSIFHSHKSSCYYAQARICDWTTFNIYLLSLLDFSKSQLFGIIFIILIGLQLHNACL